MLVHHSVTRRKACAECVRVKRRCDLVLPLCTRCSKRGLTCRYDIPSKATPKRRPAHEPAVAQKSNQVPVASPAHRDPTYSGLNTASFDRLPIDKFNFPELAPISREQVDFTVRHFQAYITQLVQGRPSPFIHHAAYHETLSPQYQDLLGVSAMYSQKTPRSQQVVFSMLDKSILRLASNSSSWAFEELLLATQALIVYQTIRLFDGDVRQRVNAERQFPALEAWTVRLQEASTIYQSGLGLSQSAYDRWIVVESARRTVLVSVMLQAIYTLLKDGICSSVPIMAALPVSLNGRLWTMSENEWWQATAGAETGLVTYRRYVSKWNNGDPLQIDAYETMLLVACQHNAKRMSLVDTTMNDTGSTPPIYDVLTT